MDKIKHRIETLDKLLMQIEIEFVQLNEEYKELQAIERKDSIVV